jgi:tellurite resistance protein
MADLEQARRIIELMVLTAWADGRVEGTEALTIHKLVTAIPELRPLGATGEISRATKARLDEIGLPGAVKEAAQAITDKRYRELAFQCCAKISGADGDFVPEEAQVLAQLQALFGFTAEDVNRLLVLATHA